MMIMTFLPLSSKSYRYDNERDNVTVTLSSINNKINKINNNNNNKSIVIVTVTLTCVLSLRYLFYLELY
jgi:hypothetical protein